MTEAEATAYLGDLLLHNNRLDEAAAHLDRALAQDANLAMAHASLGMVRMRQRRFDEAKRHLQQAVAANAQNYLAHYYYAYALSREGMNEMGTIQGYPRETAREMRAALEKAIGLRPDFPENYHLLAWINLVTGERLDEGVQLINKARALAPGNDEYALVLAQLYLRQENYEAARRTIEPLAAEGGDQQMRASARSLLNAIKGTQEQMERYKKMRESAAAGGAGESGGGRPRLGRRSEAGGGTEAVAPKEPSPEEAMTAALAEALRKPLAGETRVQGMLTRIECSAKLIVFHIRLKDGGVLKLQSAAFADVDITAYTQEAGSDITCGARKPESFVIVTYRAAAGGKAKADGVVTALEFVPSSFQLKQ